MRQMTVIVQVAQTVTYDETMTTKEAVQAIVEDSTQRAVASIVYPARHLTRVEMDVIAGDRPVDVQI